MRVNRFKGQNVTEYAILFAIVAAVFIGMQTYIKRGIQGSLKFFGDQIGKEEDYINKDPTKGELTEAKSTDNVEETTKIGYTGGTQTTVTSQTSTKGEGSYTLYKAGFTEGKFQK